MNTNNLDEAVLPDGFDKAFVDALCVDGELTHFSEMELQSLREGKKGAFTLPMETPEVDNDTLTQAFINHTFQTEHWWKVGAGEQTYFLWIIDRHMYEVRDLTQEHIIYSEGFTEPGITLHCCQNFLGFEPVPDDPEHHTPICCQKPFEEPDFEMPFYTQLEKRYGKARYQWEADQPILFVYFACYHLQLDGSMAAVERPEDWYTFEPEDYGDSDY